MVDRLRRFFADYPRRGIAAAYLFGSHAHGKAHRDSDVDIAILAERTVLPTAADRFDLRLHLTASLGPGIDADVVILNDAPPLLGRAIIYSAIPIVIHDPAAVHDFTRDVQLRAADLEPQIRRHRRRLAEILSR